MKKEDKLYLKRKYGYSKILYFIHLLGRYCKELYHPGYKGQKVLLF